MNKTKNIAITAFNAAGFNFNLILKFVNIFLFWLLDFDGNGHVNFFNFLNIFYFVN